MKAPELLVAAANISSAAAALDCGADSVYINAPGFRSMHPPLSEASGYLDIARLIEHAHSYKAKVYINLPGFFNDKALEDALTEMRRLWDMGADAFIISDLGFLELQLPPAPLILSAEGCCDSKEKAAFYEKCGFSRLCLPSEFSLSDIKKVRSLLKCELDFLVYGSLCAAKSGQCYLSYALSGSSKPLNACFSPCRHEYTCFNNSGEKINLSACPLSLKDMNLSKRLNSLWLAGINSFRINAAVHEIGQIKNITALYRSLLDKLLAKHNLNPCASGIIKAGFIPNAEKNFNRGYTAFLLDGNPKDIIAPPLQGFSGERIGTAYALKPGSFQLSSASCLAAGDKLSWQGGSAAVNGISGLRVRIDNMSGLKCGSEVFRYYDRVFMQAARTQASERSLRLYLKLSEYEEGFILSGEDELGRKAELKFAAKHKLANNASLARETILRQLSKLGGSAFKLFRLDISPNFPYFLAVSQLNDMRRLLISALSKQGFKYLRREIKLKKTRHSFPLKCLDYTANISNLKARAFYLRHGAEVTEEALGYGGLLKERAIMKLNFCLRKQAGLCNKGKDSSPFFLKSKNGDILRIEFMCKQCSSSAYLHSLGKAVGDREAKSRAKSKRQ